MPSSGSSTTTGSSTPEEARPRAMIRADDRPRPAWPALVALAGAATAIVIVVYLVGGAIVWERLHVLRLPANQAVAPLPRNLLLVDGVRALAWPVALGLLAAVLVGALVRVIESDWSGGPVLCIALAAVWIALLIVAAVFFTVQQSIFVASLGVLVFGGLAAVLRGGATIRGVAVGAALAMAGVGVVVEAIDIRNLPVRMEYAHVQFPDGHVLKGFYVGATSDAVYIAPNDGCRVLGRIETVPEREVARVVVYRSSKVWSEESHPDTCPTPP